ncbi:hypothetical protein EDD18DRAFT_1110249 [Armillaria luteobubalina]|uniref:Uncharacterized protein n=1 Tax=Armillaria luteobubalina TaxID=153913 RepID=A0AA39PR32_9AGAR|nr:hypothetical protein EDD18DRAFT_1110249 [Armillaria luteobubalina]
MARIDDNDNNSKDKGFALHTVHQGTVHILQPKYNMDKFYNIAKAKDTIQTLSEESAKTNKYHLSRIIKEGSQMTNVSLQKDDNNFVWCLVKGVAKESEEVIFVCTGVICEADLLPVIRSILQWLGKMDVAHTEDNEVQYFKANIGNKGKWRCTWIDTDISMSWADNTTAGSMLSHNIQSKRHQAQNEARSTSYHNVRLQYDFGHQTNVKQAFSTRGDGTQMVEVKNRNLMSIAKTRERKEKERRKSQEDETEVVAPKYTRKTAEWESHGSEFTGASKRQRIPRLLMVNAFFSHDISLAKTGHCRGNIKALGLGKEEYQHSRSKITHNNYNAKKWNDLKKSHGHSVVTGECDLKKAEAMDTVFMHRNMSHMLVRMDKDHDVSLHEDRSKGWRTCHIPENVQELMQSFKGPGRNGT